MNLILDDDSQARQKSKAGSGIEGVSASNPEKSKEGSAVTFKSIQRGLCTLLSSFGIQAKKSKYFCVCPMCRETIRWIDYNTHIPACASSSGRCAHCGLEVPGSDLKEHILVKCSKILGKDEHQNDRNEFFENCMMARYPVSGVKRDEDLYFAHQSKMDEPKIPCEFCDELFPASEVILHTAGCNPEEVSLPKPVSTVRQKGNETCSRQLKRFNDSTITSEPFFPAGRGTSIPSTKYEITYKRLEKSISGQYLENVAPPKVAKCSYCKTTLNDNILLFHEKECVYQPTKCPDCSATMLLKDGDSHFCKPAKENNKVSEIDLLSKNLKDLFTDENCWDTVLQVGNKEFKAHRTILIARSSVFSAMFQHDTSEKQTGLIKVPDCDPDTFKEFLEYLYCGKLENISSDCALHLYTISDKYNVQELKSFCAKYLMQNITTENICEVAILADTYDETELFSAVQDFFNKNFKEIVMISVWEDLFKKNFRLANKLLIGKAKVE